MLGGILLDNREEKLVKHDEIKSNTYVLTLVLTSMRKGETIEKVGIDVKLALQYKTLLRIQPGNK